MRNPLCAVAALCLAVAAVVSMPQVSATPGSPVGNATIRVTGSSGPVTIRYRINDGAEQTETGVALPWEKPYPVYDEKTTSVSADAGDTPLTCTIIMDGKLASYQTEPRPTCSFAYFG